MGLMEWPSDGEFEFLDTDLDPDALFEMAKWNAFLLAWNAPRCHFCHARYYVEIIGDWPEPVREHELTCPL